MTAVTTTHPETFRPALHYTARNTWLNDPNGLIHHQGLYHLYYQNNPFGNTWGNMSWGHATSDNLVDWTEQAVAIACDDQEDIFSGSIVFDSQNSSGFGTETTPPLVAIYTSAYKEASPWHGGQAQSLAYSLDGGFTWEKYAGNPVLTRNSANFRDPKVFRYDGKAGSYWVMTAVEAHDYKVVLYKSEDLKTWEHLSDFGPANATGGIWECPDLFALPVDDNPLDFKWVLTVNLNPGGPNGGSAGQYFTGDFDGVRFTSDSTITSGEQDPDRLQEYDWLDWGRDYYAAVSFSDAPDGRRIMIGWMNNWDYANQIPTSPWRSPMSLPRELSLATVDSRTILVQKVVEEAVGRDEVPEVQVGPIHLSVDTRPIPAATGTVQLIEAEFTAGTAEEFGLIVRGNGTEGTRIGINPAQGRLILDRTASGDTSFHDGFSSVDTAPINARDGRYELKIYLDHCSVEVFAQHGELVLTDLIFPDKTSTGVSIYAHGGSATLESLTITPLA
ncbi:glycoside hydrolase family 32 protein [Arthrobacter sp. PsM3]|uniref:glycoside hydrolase family 32 protein n=1 Tax=Arthrobacter sp. PsM3 TaxID=3030531 RepID=UPI00263ABB44|nr:glycoside hydrolase family 32 protein [Arthrobacter sp. PsM3]MDN4646236.1 glycoside hydrolase family 32 protein [Arthrobacter sp. PsM3]